IHFRSPAGVPYQPHGHHRHVNTNHPSWHMDVGGDVRLGQTSYAYIDGTCQGWLPRGEVLVEVVRGFEYEPLRTKVEIRPGQRELTLRIRRWANLNAERWFSGDTHVHFLSTQGCHYEARAEDLNVVNLLLSQWGSLFTNAEEFTGNVSVAPDGRTIVYATQENRQHMLGHLTLLGLKEPVMPWCSDGPTEAELGGTMETTLSHWSDACRRQGGTVIVPHAAFPNGELAAMIATGRVDGIEMLWLGEYYHNEYYRYLNCGYRLPLVGGTDKMASETPVGIYRTYVFIPPDEEFSYESWLRNLRRGRTFLSAGPILRFTVDGQTVGDTVRLPGNGGTVEVEARADSAAPVNTLQVVQAGRVVAEVSDSNGVRSLHLRARLKVEGSTWLAARAGGPEYWNSRQTLCSFQRGVFAHTSPVYVACGGDWGMFDHVTAQYMLTMIDGCLTYIRQSAWHHRPEMVTRHHGEEDHQAYLERPFLEAREAIHQRQHLLGLPH
ncbi:MAG: CehA/McbA family metallohydrolase, partial [Chloroflexi bacterium]|nr:CehA/McbA family metallohydrolase [Chloroflexota bacterium]